MLSSIVLDMLVMQWSFKMANARELFPSGNDAKNFFTVAIFASLVARELFITGSR